MTKTKTGKSGIPRAGSSIDRSQRCPALLLGSPCSRWGITKVHMKTRLVKAGERLYSHRTGAEAEPPPDELRDGRPVALVGPVIGLVTSTSARILLEVDRDATVEMILLKEEERPPRVDSARSIFSLADRSLRSSSSSARHPLLKASRSSMSEAGSSNAERTSSMDSSYNSTARIDLQSSPAPENPKPSPVPTLSGPEQCGQSSPHSLKGSPIARANALGAGKTETETVENHANSSFSSLSSPSLSKNMEKGRSMQAKLSGSLHRRGSLSFSFMKLLRRQQIVGSSRKKHSSANLLSQGSGSNRKVISRIEEMQARHPTVFKFEMLEPRTRYFVEVKDCHKVEQSSFKTFPVKIPNQFCIASISCNSIFITKKTITAIDDLWNHLSKSIESGEVNLLIHLGDQVYGDGDCRLDAGAGKNRDKWSNRFKIGLDMLKDFSREKWASKHDDICEKYREVYRDTWKHPHTAKCLANCPSLMIYDDHEIRDNWGDNPLDHRKDSMEYFIAKCAWIVTLEYQRQLFEDVDFSNLDAIQKDHYFHVIDKIGLMFLDIRGSRTFHRVESDQTPYLGSRQWQDIDEALEDGGTFDKVQVLVICSPAPLVFLVPAVTVAAPNVVDRLEDFKGHWSAYKHEQKRMIDSLERWKESRNGREVIVLGGDVHCGGHSCILKLDKTLFNQLTTSPIANMPLPKAVYYAMRVAEQLERNEGFRFHHFNWTRARNYGLVHINFHSEDENKIPEIVTELVRGKFLRPVMTGRRVSNLEPCTPTWCCKMPSCQGLMNCCNVPRTLSRSRSL